MYKIEIGQIERKMKIYKVTYKLFSPIRGMETDFRVCNVKATDESQAVEKLKAALKTNGHRLLMIKEVETSNNPDTPINELLSPLSSKQREELLK